MTKQLEIGVEETPQQENQLAVILKESGLEQTKAQVILNNFSDYFKIAAEWELKAKTLTVTDESQVTEMKMAGEARKFLKKKRTAIEETRKTLKDASLKEGQTIDAIAKILKNLIEPIEDQLEKQEKFAEIKEAERKQARKEIRVKKLTELEFDFTYTDLLNMSDESYDALILKLENERDARIENERIAEEKRLAEIEAKRLDDERIRVENEKLKAEQLRLQEEAEAKELQLEKERKEADDKLRKQQAEAEAKAKEQQRIADEKLAEQNRLAKIEADKQAEIIRKQQAEIKAKEEAERKEKERVEAELKAKEKAEKEALKAPDKDKLTKWVDNLVLPAIVGLTPISEPTYNAIYDKFEGFKKWAKSEIEKL